jgi:hypothetical protein
MPDISPEVAQERADAAQRLSDAVTLALLGQGRGVVGKWLAAKLSDGSTDGNVYDSKADAIRHQLHETQCAYVCIPMDGMTPRQAGTYLRFNAGLYAAGHRLADPATHAQMPGRREAVAPMLRAIRKGR